MCDVCGKGFVFPVGFLPFKFFFLHQLFLGFHATTQTNSYRRKGNTLYHELLNLNYFLIFALNQPYKCDFDESCQRHFTNLSQMKRHVRGAHKNEKVLKLATHLVTLIISVCLTLSASHLHRLWKSIFG